MTAVIGEQGSDGGGLDLMAVNRDAELLDLLARRAPVPPGDPVLALLAALAADVDEGLDELLVASEDDPLTRAAAAATVVPQPAAVRSGHGLRATTVAIVVGATLSIGGVAAAVTGDPLAPVKGIATAVGIGHAQHEGKAAAQVANQHARSALAHGDIAGAQASLATMKEQLLRGDLSEGDRRSIEARIAALEKQVDRAVAAQAAGQPGSPDGHAGGQANGSDNGGGSAASGAEDENGKGEKATSGKPASKPNATRTTTPGAGADNAGKKDDDADSSDGSDASDTPVDRVRPTGGSDPSRPEPSSTSDESSDAPATEDADAGGSAGATTDQGQDGGDAAGSSAGGNAHGAAGAKGASAGR